MVAQQSDVLEALETLAARIDAAINAEDTPQEIIDWVNDELGPILFHARRVAARARGVGQSRAPADIPGPTPWAVAAAMLTLNQALVKGQSVLLTEQQGRTLQEYIAAINHDRRELQDGLLGIKAMMAKLIEIEETS